MDIRDKIITGSFAIGPDGKKEPIDWKDYALKLEKLLASQSFIDTGVEEAAKKYADYEVGVYDANDPEHVVVNEEIETAWQHEYKKCVDTFIAGYKWASSGEAVEFANWIKKEGFNQRSGVDWAIHRTFLSDVEIYTTEQLYQLFKQK